jgi:hypothetical protein
MHFVWKPVVLLSCMAFYIVLNDNLMVETCQKFNIIHVSFVLYFYLNTFHFSSLLSAKPITIKNTWGIVIPYLIKTISPDVIITVRLCILLHNCRAEVQMSCVSIASFRLEGRIWPHDWSSCCQHASKHTEYYYILCQAVYFVHVTAFLLNFSHTMLTSEFKALAIVGIVTLYYYVRFIHWLRNDLTSISLICSSAEYVLHICCQHGLWQRWANVTLL